FHGPWEYGVQGGDVAGRVRLWRGDVKTTPPAGEASRQAARDGERLGLQLGHHLVDDLLQLAGEAIDDPEILEPVDDLGQLGHQRLQTLGHQSRDVGVVDELVQPAVHPVDAPDQPVEVRQAVHSVGHPLHLVYQPVG